VSTNEIPKLVVKKDRKYKHKKNILLTRFDSWTGKHIIPKDLIKVILSRISKSDTERLRCTNNATLNKGSKSPK
jgi:hypothetical protein